MNEITHYPERLVEANGLQINTEAFGDKENPALLCIVGLGAHMFTWPRGLCEMFAEAGYFVIRFDNRDVGKSQWMDELPVPKLGDMLNREFRGKLMESPYSIQDMADDAVGVLDAWGIQKAHIMGMSMGGMIAQRVAIHHPSRTNSLISFMSTTGEDDLSRPSLGALMMLMKKPATTRASYIDSSIESTMMLAGSGYYMDKEDVYNLYARSYDRGNNPAGGSRQLGAVVTDGGRRTALGWVTVPALVLHGDEDKLVPFDGGKDTYNALPNAHMHVFKGLGHVLPKSLFVEYRDAVVEFLSEVGSQESEVGKHEDLEIVAGD